MDGDALRDKYEEFHAAFPGASIFYAIKANPDVAVVQVLNELGSGFEVGTESSLRFLLDLGVPASRIISGNPLKPPAFVQLAYSAGVRRMTVDSTAEVDKIARLAPGSEVYVRISVPNEYSEWPLDRKYGVATGTAVELLVKAREKGLLPIGVTCHVGSQCTSPVAWSGALEQSAEVWQGAAGRGIRLSSLNIEGGFPAEYTRPVPSVADFAHTIDEGLRRNFPPGTELVLEPGRGLVGDAGVLVTSVIAKAERDGKRWLYLDAGVFNGLLESIGGIRYALATTKEGAKARYVVAGPSCDSMDVLPGEFDLPDLDIGDHVFIMSAGAYTTAYASQFDGISIPRVVVL
jgi:ornithine decarboxylase